MSFGHQPKAGGGHPPPPTGDSGISASRQFFLTGRYRLRPDGDRVVLQLHERTRPMAPPAERWRDATPQDVMSMVGVQIEPTSLRIGGDPDNPPRGGSSGSRR